MNPTRRKLLVNNLVAAPLVFALTMGFHYVVLHVWPFHLDKSLAAAAAYTIAAVREMFWLYQRDSLG